LYNGPAELEIGPIWRSDTAGSGGEYLKMRSDGNLCIYDKAGGVKWASGSNKGAAGAPYKLVVLDEGNLVIYNKDMIAIWAAHPWSVKIGYK
jgi:hypothetical protein